LKLASDLIELPAILQRRRVIYGFLALETLLHYPPLEEFVQAAMLTPHYSSNELRANIIIQLANFFHMACILELENKIESCENQMGFSWSKDFTFSGDCQRQKPSKSFCITGMLSASGSEHP
jgi:hypothetical protein